MGKIKKTISVFLMGFGLLLPGCGNVGSVDPLSLFNDTSVPPLESIFSGYSFFQTSGQAFTASTPFWVFVGNGTWGGNFIAPARGVITSVGQGSFNGVSGFALTISHSGRLATRYIGITPIVRSGDTVLQGQIIGAITGFNANQIAFQVLLDGVPVCPLSFISQNFRASMNIYFAAGFLCN